MKKRVPTLLMAISATLGPILASAQTTGVRIGSTTVSAGTTAATRTATGISSTTAAASTTNGRVTSVAASRTNAVTRTNNVVVTNNVVSSNFVGNLTRADAHFLAVAAIDSLHEIAIGFLAQTNSTNADVQAFGAKLVEDHTAAYNAAVAVASSNNITLPSTETRVQQGQTTRLSRLSGRQFDVAFDNIMISSHQQDISLFEGEAIRANDPDVRAYARAQLPVLVDHFVTALEVRESLRQSASTSTTTLSSSQ